MFPTPFARGVCPSDEELSSFDRGYLSGLDIDRVVAHLESVCDRCSAYLARGSNGDEFAAALRAGGEGAARLEPANPQMIEGYEILEELGEGGMGIVYKARQVRLNRIVALKMVLGGQRAGSRELIRFLAEAESVAAVRHPNVVHVYEYGDAGGRPFLAMEYLAGGSLAQALKAQGPREPRSAATLLAKLARAVHAAHQLGIVHRDLKPANVLFDESGEPKVTDFGLAKRGEANVTASQAIMGTPAYMAPEQARGETKFVGPEADVYSLGVILYECLVGRVPFEAASSIAILRQVVEEEPARPGRRVPGLPREIEWICMKCLAKNPEERYRSAAALADDLNRFLAGEPVDVRAITFLHRGYKWARRKPTAALAYGLSIIAVLLVAVGTSMAVLWSRADDARRTAESTRDELGEQKKEAERLRHQFERSDYSARMQLAQQEWQDDQAHVARDLLNGVGPHLRSWEWHYLQRKFTSEDNVIGRHSARNGSFGITPDGSRVRLLGWDGCVREWDVVARREIGTPVSLVPPGQTFSTMDRHAGHVAVIVPKAGVSELSVWDLVAREFIRNFPPGNSRVVLSPGGKLIAIGDDRGWVKIYEVVSGAILADWHADNETDLGPGNKKFPQVRSLGFSGDGKRLVVGCRDRVHVWDVEKRECVGFGPGYLKSRSDELHGLTCTAFLGNDLNRIVSGGYFDPRVPERAELLLHDLRNPNNPPRIFLNQFRSYVPIAVSPDGTRIAVSDGTRRTLILDGNTGRELFQIHPLEPIVFMQFAPGSQRLISADTSGTIRRWELSNDPAGEIIQLDGKSRVFGMVPVDDGRRVIFTTHGDREDDPYHLTIWDRETQKPVGVLPLDHRGLAPSDIALSPDGTRIAVGVGKGVVQVWDWRQRRRLAVMAGRMGDPGVSRVAFLPDGRVIVGLQNGSVRLWNPDSPGEEKELHNRSTHLMAMVLSPDGRTLALGGGSGQVELLRSDTGELLRTIEFDGEYANSLAFSRDGNRLAMGTMNFVRSQCSIQIWNWEAGTRIARTDAAHTSPIPFLAFSPDDKRVISGSIDETIKVWDAELGTKHLTLRGHTSAINRGALLPNGLLFTSSWDGTVRVWNGREEK